MYWALKYMFSRGKCFFMVERFGFGVLGLWEENGFFERMMFLIFFFSFGILFYGWIL